MKTDDHFATFSKTQKQMYSTMVPLSTPRRRYGQKDQSTTLRRSVFDRTNLQSSHNSATMSKDLKEHRRQLNTPNLPQLKKPKAFMLEQWLNQALEGGGEVDASPNNQSLKTLKKYSLDKGNLRNFNLSFQTIQRLHTTLFIYSQGIKNIFSQMLTQASTGGHNDNSFPKLYFKVFLKLLQNIMPIKTCFHLIEQSLKKEISDLKKEKSQLIVKVEEQKKNALQIQNKFKKEIESLENKIKKIMVDYQIMESTLQMYEISFNEEVALRLKFQEKINIAYTCYEELKDKYEALRQEFGYKANALADNNMEQMSIKDQLHTQTLKNNELLKQLQHLQRKVAQLDKDLMVKNQEIMDLSLMNRKEEQQKVAEENVIDEMMLNIKILKIQKEDDSNKIKQLNESIVKYQETIQKLKNDVIYARDKNDEIYIKYHQKTLQIIPLQKDIYEKQLKISALSTQNSSLIASKELLSEQLEQTTIQLKEAQNIQATSNKDIELYSSQLEKMNATIIELKDVKDKYQRLSYKLSQELAQARKEVQKKVVQIVESKGKCVDLQFHLSELQKVKNQYEAKMFQLQKQLTKKDKQLDQRKGLERKKLREVQSQVQKKNMELQNKKQAYQRLQKESNLKDNQRMKKIQQISFLRKSTAILETENKLYKNKLNQLKSEVEKKERQIQTFKKELDALNFTIIKKRQEIDGQIINLKLKITQLKQKLNYKAQYVHPMIVEDMEQQIARLRNEIQTINQNNAEVNRTYDSIKNELQNKRNESSCYRQEVESLKRKIDKCQLQLAKIREEKRREDQKRGADQDERRTKLKQKDKTIESLKNTIKSKQEQAAVNIKAAQKMKEEFQKCRRQLNRSKNSSMEVIVQTDCTNPDKLSTSSQTDNFIMNSSPNGRKLTTSDRLRNKVQEPQPSLIQMPLQQKKTELTVKNQAKTAQEKQPMQEKAEKKVEDREFKAALRLTYMRK